MRCHSWTRQTLSDAREPMNLENWFGALVPMATGSRVMMTETKLANRCRMMNPELKLTKRVTADEEGTRFMMPRIVVEKPRDVERGRFYGVSADIEAHGRVGRCLGCELLKAQGEATKSCRHDFPRASRNDCRENLGGRSQEGNVQGQSR